MLNLVDRGTAVTIYYDGDCPFCSDYVRYLRLRESVGAPPKLIDLRADPTAREQLEAQGFDLDRGMVADIGGVRSEGAEALQALALLTTRSGLFNRATAAVFSSPTAARLAYPVLRAGRNTMLMLLGRESFRADDAGWQALFTIFSLIFGLFAIHHFIVYAFQFRQPIYPNTWALLILGCALFLRPGSTRIFAVLIVVMLLDAWLQSPMQSNHTILKNFLLLSLLGAGVWHLFKGSRWSVFFRDAVPVGRVLLLVMYFFGVFHKINGGFLDPAVSCAVTLWRMMPWPLPLLDNSFIHYLTIYGTLAVEALIVVLLLLPRWRWWGIGLGIGFHSMLAFSAFAIFPAFSTLTIALHILFLSPEDARGIVRGDRFQRLLSWLRSWWGLGALLIALTLAAASAITGQWNGLALVWLAMAAPIFLIIFMPGPARSDPRESRSAQGVLLWSRLGWLNIVGVLFFLNCTMPYLGLKTAQTMNMFANLRLEGGVNNHLVMAWAPAPFGYLDDLVELRSADGDPVIHQPTGSAVGDVYYRLLDRLDRHPDASVTFVRDGILHENETAETLADDIAATLHPAWVRKWFHFAPVLLDNPPPCR